MEIALKFNELQEDKDLGLETVLFRKQMLRDVYYHEGEPLPSLPDFIGLPLTRQHDQTFWVYRQGTYIPNYVFFGGELYVGHAPTSDLDESTPHVTFEGYHHVKKLLLEGGGLLAVKDNQRFTLQQQRANLTDLYEDIVNYGIK